MPHYWLTYNKNGTRLGALILKSDSLTQARMNAATRGLDQRAEFADGQEIDRGLAALLPPEAVARMFTPDQGHVLLDYLEEKGRRVAVLDGKPAERNDALNRENAAERTNRRGFLGSLILGRTRRTGST
jgi:hypothetical protein